MRVPDGLQLRVVVSGHDHVAERHGVGRHGLDRVAGHVERDGTVVGVDGAADVRPVAADGHLALDRKRPVPSVLRISMPGRRPTTAKALPALC